MSSPQHEPTMEEILASIRKIISEDNPEAAPPAAAAAPAPKPAAAPAPAPAPEPAKQPEMEVLELTQEVVEPEPAPAPEPPPAEPPLEEKTEEIVFEPIGAREPPPAAINDIFSDQTRKALEDTFDSIPDEADEPAPARAYRPATAADGASVESVFERAVRESFEPVLEKYLQDNSGLVIERMKPLIREWMDENFPALLENAVRGEVERIVKARTRR